jgi:cell wall-associated NlpC family hydrolase
MRARRTLAAGALAAATLALGAGTASSRIPADPGGGGGSGSGPGVSLPAVDGRFAAKIATDNGIAVSGRKGPRTAAREVVKLASGQDVKIVCQTRGERVTGKFGTSNLWDLVAIGGGRGVYVTDTYVATGSDGRVAPPCARRSGPAPQTPGDDDGSPATGSAARVLTWARRHVSWWAGKYSMTYRLPTDLSVRQMRRTQPPRGGNQGCDCSSFARWAMAQAGVDIGTYTGNIWTANGRLSNTTSGDRTADGRVVRGYGNQPPGGYRRGDLIFWGVSGLDKDVGHVAIYSGKGRIIQCSGSLGSNAGRSITSNGTPTGWVRYTKVR